MEIKFKRTVRIDGKQYKLEWHFMASCPECDFNVSGGYVSKDILMESPKEEPQWKCPKCGVQFDTQYTTEEKRRIRKNIEYLNEAEEYYKKAEYLVHLAFVDGSLKNIWDR